MSLAIQSFKKMPLMFLLLMAFSLTLFACGDEETGSAPEISDVQIKCGPAPSSSYVDQEVVAELSVKIEDADRDLVRVTANINGYNISELTDDDADLRYNWSPPNSLDPMLCKGELTVRVEATDNEGHVTLLSETVTK